MAFVPDQPQPSGRFVPDAAPAAGEIPVTGTPLGPKDVPDSPPQGATPVAAPQQKPGLLRRAATNYLGNLEAAGSVVTGLPAQVLGRATAIGAIPFTEAPFGTQEAARQAQAVGGRVADALTYTPRTEAGKDTLERFGRMVEASKIEGLGPVNPAAGLGGTSARLPLSGRPVAPKVAAAAKSGFSLTPDDAGAGIVSRTAAGLSGEPKLAQAVSKKNIAVANEKIAADLGLPKGAPLSAENLGEVERAAWARYAAVRKVGRMKTDGTYRQQLDDLEAPFKSAAEDFGEASAKLGGKDAQEMVAAMRKSEFDSNSAVDLVQRLRSNADKAYANGDRDYARLLRNLGQVVEDQIGRHLEETGSAADAKTVADYRSARTTLAQVHQARKSLAGGENIDPQAYAKTMRKSPGLLTGGGREVGQFAVDFPRSAQKMPKGSVGAPTWSDLVLGGLSGAGSIASHGAITPETFIPAAAAVAARPAARGILASRPYQNMMTRPAGANIPIPSPQAAQALGIAPQLIEQQP